MQWGIPMTDIGELTGYVESNPQDHEQRWHLAKKLYMAGDYRSALGHMLILQTNWTPKINVLRYLAATYYRLERYDEALAELRAGIEEWPDESALREQMARVLEVAGRYEEAIAAWEDILKENPNNSMAKRLLRRLQEAKPGQKEQSEPPSERGQPSRASTPSAFERTCPSCGAQNSEEFDRCWKCHAPLGTYGMPAYSPTPKTRMAAPRIPRNGVQYTLCALAAAAVLGYGAYLSVHQLGVLRAATENPAALCTVRDVFDNSLLSTRIATGLILFVVWPLVIWFTTALMQPMVSVGGPFLVGALMASAGYLSLWCAPADIPFAFAGSVFLAIVPIIGVLRLRIGPALVVWVLQAAVVLCAALGSAAALEGTTFLREYPLLMQYARTHDGVRDFGGEPGWRLIPSLYVPVQTSVRWDSTGSTWLDARATRADFEITASAPISDLTVEICKDKKDTLFYEHATSVPYKFSFDKISPGVTYPFQITGQANANLDVSVRGLMDLHFGN